jgi:hypothetical protein
MYAYAMYMLKSYYRFRRIDMKSARWIPRSLSAFDEMEMILTNGMELAKGDVTARELNM